MISPWISPCKTRTPCLLALHLSPRWCGWRSLAYNWHAGQRYCGSHNGRETQTGEETDHGKETSQCQRRPHQGWEGIV